MGFLVVLKGDSCFSKCVVQAFRVITDVDLQPILIHFVQVDVDLDSVDQGSLRHHDFDTTHELDHRPDQPLSSVWPVQPPINHIHVYVQLSQWNLGIFIFF